MTSPRGFRAAAGDDVTAMADGAEATGNGAADHAAADDGATGVTGKPGTGSPASPVAEARSGHARAVDTRTRDDAEPDAAEGARPSQPDRPYDEPGPQLRESGGYQHGPLWARWLPPV